jgi:hypothetical protein
MLDPEFEKKFFVYPIAEPPKPSGIGKKLVIILVLFLILALAYAFWKYNLIKYIAPEIVQDQGNEQQQQITPRPLEEGIFEGYILYVKDRDLWRAEPDGTKPRRLIDSGSIVAASYSLDRKMIAFVMEKQVTEQVLDNNSKPKSLQAVRNQLFVTDAEGKSPVLVKDGVWGWGWVPSSNLLWYETSSLQKFFYWGYYGNKDLTVYNIDTGQSTVMLSPVSDKLPFSRLGGVWSPDGNKYSYFEVGTANSLHVIDRNTSKLTKLYDLPSVGSNRLGPPPIPSVFWDSNSRNLYSAFTPIQSKNPNPQFFKPGYAFVVKISAETGELTVLADDSPSPLINADIDPQLAFSQDFSKVAHLRYNLGDLNFYKPDEWAFRYSAEKGGALSLVMYYVLVDLATKQEIVLRSSYVPESNTHSFIFDDGVVVFGELELSNELIYRKYGFDGKVQTVKLYGKSKNETFRDIKKLTYVPKTKEFYFLYDGRAYRLKDGVFSEVLGADLLDVDWAFE